MFDKVLNISREPQNLKHENLFTSVMNIQLFTKIIAKRSTLGQIRVMTASRIYKLSEI